MPMRRRISGRIWTDLEVETVDDTICENALETLGAVAGLFFTLPSMACM